LLTDIKNQEYVDIIKSYYLLRKLNDLQEKHSIDLYYIHYLTNAYFLNEFIEICDKKIYIHCHGYDVTWNLKHHSNSLINYHPTDYLPTIKQLTKKATFIANSEFTKQKLLKINISCECIKVLRFGCHVEGLSSNNKNRRIKILYLGRLVDFKGPDLTIKAFEKACELGLIGDLIIAGDGPLRITCQLLKIRSKYSKNIEILGPVNYEKGRALRQECDIFTAHNMKGSLTNQEEAYGVSIIEAMGAGLPIVTGESGGIVENVINSKTGLLFKPGNVDQHAEYLLRIAKDKLFRKELSVSAFNHVNAYYSIEHEKLNLLKILNNEYCNNHH
jgi:glycosyltransferase involved in cell wall biosynthesis